MCCGRSGDAEGRFAAGFPVSAVSALRFEGCRPSRSVSTPSVPVATRSGVIAWVSGVADLLSTRSVPFRPSFRGIFDSLWVVSTLSHPVSTLLPSGFSALSVGLDTLGTPSDPPADGFDPLRPPNRVSTLSFARDTLSDPTPVSALHFCGLFYVSNPFLHFRVFLSISK